MLALAYATEREYRPAVRLLGDLTPVPGLAAVWRAHGGCAPVLVMRTGVGARRAGAATRRMLAALRPACVLSLGAAGALDPRLDVGDLVLVSRVQAPGGAWFACDAQMQRMLAGHLQAAGLAHVAGDCLTCRQFVHSTADKVRLQRASGALVVDMECAAIARACQQLGIPFATVRSVSDSARRTTFDAAGHHAARRGGRLAVARFWLGRPWSVPQALQLQRGMQRASRQLAAVARIAARVSWTVAADSDRNKGVSHDPVKKCRTGPSAMGPLPGAG